MQPGPVFIAGAVLRLLFLLFGYTDIDYLVFTDASRFVAHGRSPYDRATYRYTPLLAWMLYPTVWPGWFEAGKFLFAGGDLVTGWLIYIILRQGGMENRRAIKYSCIWQLNPIVASISTRGSSEGVLAIIVVALLWAALRRRVVLTGCLLGLAVHFKIYPFIYAASIFWAFDGPASSDGSLSARLASLINADRVKLTLSSLVVFASLNAIMYTLCVLHETSCLAASSFL